MKKENRVFGNGVSATKKIRYIYGKYQNQMPASQVARKQILKGYEWMS